jgi:hypothetical protein
MEWVVYHIVCGYVACVLECCGGGIYKVVSNMTGTDYTMFTHKSVPVIFETTLYIMCGYVACACNHTLYDVPPIRFVFQVTQADL